MIRLTLWLRLLFLRRDAKLLSDLRRDYRDIALVPRIAASHPLQATVDLEPGAMQIVLEMDETRT